MKIAVIADEVSGDLETALELIRSWGADAVELRFHLPRAVIAASSPARASSTAPAVLGGAGLVGNHDDRRA